MVAVALKMEDKLPLVFATILKVVDRLAVAEFMANKIEAKASFEVQLNVLELKKAPIAEGKSKKSLKELLVELLGACFEEE